LPSFDQWAAEIGSAIGGESSQSAAQHGEQLLR
jgi:hypothetical protein